MSHLHVDSVRKSYGNNLILSDVFLSCKTGEIKGLIGRNGCGKSTLLKIIFGVEKAEFSFVRVNNKVIRNISDGRNLINYLPQDNFLPNNIKIKRLIRLFLGKKKSDLLFKNAFIKPLLNKTNNVLSGGEKRIVEILLILHSEAVFVLLDEPFNGVSPIVREQIISIINSMRNTKGIIITDHDYRNVIKLADKIVFLKDGHLKEIKKHEELIELGYLSE
ncbi:ABC-type multidrug transport system ATPase subunit [Tenacibaculum skagerrakense]|uniref:ABC-type multidrug transport system ATPase subunit n=1 Tax=Tenacibaculum skagerrakense TaxID=186571 RepID=A0A4R2NT26_9FLAO|nr:ATP-binding cassette domain-containing protein [Tenacibaculum skagerrakense]TCP24598.1 ABC-type multidrug transport system ATPase subunit [Tenacibaculum skagerrakense]